MATAATSSTDRAGARAGTNCTYVGRAAAPLGRRRKAARRTAEAAQPAGELRPQTALDALDEPRLLEQPAVDLPAQLAAHDRVRDPGDEQHGDADRQRGGHRHAPPQRHQLSRRT